MHNKSHKAAAVLGGLLVLVAGPWAPCAYGHGGEIEVAGGGAKGPVRLSEVQQKAIGLRWVAADHGRRTKPCRSALGCTTALERNKPRMARRGLAAIPFNRNSILTTDNTDEHG